MSSHDHLAGPTSVVLPDDTARNLAVGARLAQDPVAAKPVTPAMTLPPVATVPATARSIIPEQEATQLPVQTTIFAGVEDQRGRHRYIPTKTVSGLATGRDSLDCSLIMLDMPAGWQKAAAAKTPEEEAEISRRALLLSAGQREPLSKKIDFACRVIDRAMAVGGKWAISFSAGRDSTVLSHLATEVMGFKLPHVMSNTRMEQPETLRQAGRWRAWLAERGVELHTVFPAKRPGEVWAEEGLPLFSKEQASKVRQFQNTGNENHLKRLPDEMRDHVMALTAARIKATERCCDVLKKDPLHAWDREHGVTGHLHGVRAEESRSRRMIFIQQGALYDSARHGQWLGTPLIHWGRQDIDTYISRNRIPIEFTERTGCVTCMFGAHMTKDLNALQKLHRNNPKLWNEALDNWGYRPALDLIGVTYREPVAQASQENLWSEYGIGSKRTVSIVKPQVHEDPWERQIHALPKQLYADHLNRLDDRARGMETITAGAWFTPQELSKELRIDPRSLSTAISSWVADGSWEGRRHVDPSGIVLPEFRPKGTDDVLDRIDDLAVPHDRSIRSSALEQRAAARQARGKVRQGRPAPGQAQIDLVTA